MESVKMKRKILYITGTRADYGLMRSVLFEMEKNANIDLELVVTGMHLMEQFGMTVNNIGDDGFKFHKIDTIFEDDTKLSTVKFIGEFIKSLSELVAEVKEAQEAFARGEFRRGTVKDLIKDLEG